MSSILSSVPAKHRRIVLLWARRARAIAANPAASKTDKLTNLARLNNIEVLYSIGVSLGARLRMVLWDNQKLPVRLGIVGAIFGFGGMFLFGFKFGAIAAIAAVSLPIFLISEPGEAFLKWVCDRLEYSLFPGHAQKAENSNLSVFPKQDAVRIPSNPRTKGRSVVAPQRTGSSRH